MEVDHTFMLLLAKSFGLFCFIGASALVLIYALRPSSKDRFERVGNSIIDADDWPAEASAPPVDVIEDQNMATPRHADEASRSRP